MCPAFRQESRNNFCGSNLNCSTNAPFFDEVDRRERDETFCQANQKLDAFRRTDETTGANRDPRRQVKPKLQEFVCDISLNEACP